METAETADFGGSIPVEALIPVLEAHEVRVAIVFGSEARGDTHPLSDIDIAVEFEDRRPGDPGFNDAFFGLSADLSEVVGSDAVDVVDVHMLPPAFVEAVFDDGILLLGTQEEADRLRKGLGSGIDSARTAQERYDEALQSIDEHLG